MNKRLIFLVLGFVAVVVLAMIVSFPHPYCANIDCMFEVEETKTLVDTRPNHPRQLDLEDIEVGDILYMVTAISVEKVVIVRTPYLQNGDCKLDYIWHNVNSQYIQTAYCTDLGLVKYEHGWNPTNYLTKASPISYSERHVQKLVSGLVPAP